MVIGTPQELHQISALWKSDFWNIFGSELQDCDQRRLVLVTQWPLLISWPHELTTYLAAVKLALTPSGMETNCLARKGGKLRNCLYNVKYWFWCVPHALHPSESPANGRASGARRVYLHPSVRRGVSVKDSSAYSQHG
jgi:hypothetical protein